LFFFEFNGYQCASSRGFIVGTRGAKLKNAKTEKRKNGFTKFKIELNIFIHEYDVLKGQTKFKLEVKGGRLNP